MKTSLMAAVGAQHALPWTDELIDTILDDLVLEKTEIDTAETQTFILPAELQIVCQVVQQRGWTRSDQYSNKVKLIRDYVREAVESSPQPEIAQAILVALIHDNGLTRAEPQTAAQLASRLENVNLNDASRQLEYLDRQRRLINQITRRTPQGIDVAYELSHEYLVGVLRPLYSEYLDKTEKANTLLHQSRRNLRYDPSFRLTFSQCRLIRRYSTEPLTVQDRDLLRRGEVRAAISFVLAITLPTLLILGIRYGITSLSLQPGNSSETLVVRRGIGWLKPLLGSDQVSIQVSEVPSSGPKATSVFLENGSILFPSIPERNLYSWLNRYYFG